MFKNTENYKKLAFILPRTYFKRLGTWTTVTFYYCEHHKTLKYIINYIDKEKAIFILNLQKYFADLILAENVILIKFEFSPNTITNLGTKRISFSEIDQDLIKNVPFTER